MQLGKHEVYRNLVVSRKACRLCTSDGLTNPSEYKEGIFDADHIGLWSRWQGNLDAKLMVVGQDWGDIGYFLKYAGHDSKDTPSDKTLRELLGSIGIEIDSPSAVGQPEGVVFLTNAILCLKNAPGLGASVKSSWFKNCGKHFLKPTIEIVQPKVVVTLGVYAYESMQRLYGLPQMRFRDVVNLQEGIPLSDETLYFAMYHCSPRVLQTHRHIEQQRADWQRVKRAL